MSIDIPTANSSIEKGSSLKDLLDKTAIACLAGNISQVYPEFDKAKFYKSCFPGINNLEIMQRGKFIASKLFQFLPKPYDKAISILLESLTPALVKTEKNGLSVFFYLPHTMFVAEYGLDPVFNNGKDPFDKSMLAQYELTRRFTAEFSIRNFLISDSKRTLKYIHKWTNDSCPHVRRLCSEGTRPRLPWAIRIPEFIKDPSPTLKILQSLKDDPERYVVRSVANHIGDIAKDNPETAFNLCKNWLKSASNQRKWLIRHAVRYHARKNHPIALLIRKKAE